MRIALSVVIAALPVAFAAQESERKQDPSKLDVKVTGCTKGSTLTETNLRLQAATDKDPARRWRLRGPKALMNRIKQHEGRELEIVGTTKIADAGGTGRRIGRTNIFIGGDTNKTMRDPLPELPTIEVDSFEPTGETCR